MTHVGGAVLAQSVEEVRDACGVDPGWACEQVFRATENEALADAADLVAAAALQIALVVVVALLARWLVKKLIDRARVRIIERSTREGVEAAERQRAVTRAETVSRAFGSLAAVVIGVLATLMILGEFGLNLGPLIAGAGIVGIAIGFGAQNLVADFLSGVFMLIDDQYGEGDWVDVGETSGIVEHVGLRATTIRDMGGLLWTVRNGHIVRTANANQGWGRAVLDVGVGYRTDLRQASQLIKRVADETRADPDHADLFLGEPEIWGVQDLGDDAVVIRLAAATQPGAQWGLARELRLRIKEALEQAEIEIPFPQRTVWIRTEPETLAAPVPVVVTQAGTER